MGGHASTVLPAVPSEGFRSDVEVLDLRDLQLLLETLRAAPGWPSAPADPGHARLESGAAVTESAPLAWSVSGGVRAGSPPGALHAPTSYCSSQQSTGPRLYPRLPRRKSAQEAALSRPEKQ